MAKEEAEDVVKHDKIHHTRITGSRGDVAIMDAALGTVLGLGLGLLLTHLRAHPDHLACSSCYDASSLCAQPVRPCC